MECTSVGDRLIVCIQDEGYGFDPEATMADFPTDDAETGRGLLLMSLLMDEVTFSFNHGTKVFMSKRARPRD